MIRHIKIYNRFIMNNFGIMDHLKFPYDYWYLISIWDQEEGALKNVETLKKKGLQDIVSINFTDITDKEYEKIRKKDPRHVLFNEDHAKQIVNFMEKIQKDPQDAVLVVHCSAGISRSGAVGTFACDYCRLDYNNFIGGNHYIRANQWVLALLHRASGMTPIGVHDGIDNNFEEGEIIIP